MLKWEEECEIDEKGWRRSRKHVRYTTGGGVKYGIAVIYQVYEGVNGWVYEGVNGCDA